jgi:hypothetical protein
MPIPLNLTATYNISMWWVQLETSYKNVSFAWRYGCGSGCHGPAKVYAQFPHSMYHAVDQRGWDMPGVPSCGCGKGGSTPRLGKKINLFRVLFPSCFGFLSNQFIVHDELVWFLFIIMRLIKKCTYLVVETIVSSESHGSRGPLPLGSSRTTGLARLSARPAPR